MLSSSNDDEAEINTLSHLFTYLVGFAESPSASSTSSKLFEEEYQQFFFAELEMWKKGSFYSGSG